MSGVIVIVSLFVFFFFWGGGVCGLPCTALSRKSYVWFLSCHYVSVSFLSCRVINRYMRGSVLTR